jgi:hypothetical protein
MATISESHALPREIAYSMIFSLYLDLSIGCQYFGTKGRTGLKRFLMGSVANGVIQHSHCPVLLVR